jgi:hypothetical protein
LRSEHGVAVHIKRRYAKTQLPEEVERVGLTVEPIAHANTLLFPIAAAVRIARKWPSKPAADARSDLRPLPPTVNSWLAKVLSLETNPLRKVDLRFGLSAICAARKEPANP